MKLVGMDALLKDMKAFGPTVAKKGADVGVRKAAQMLRKKLRHAAPRKSGVLRKSIGYKYSRRTGRAWVGLRERFYYKTLEFDSNRGKALHPFFKKTWEANKREAAQMIVDEARKALYKEAGKVMARSKTRNRGR